MTYEYILAESLQRPWVFVPNEKTKNNACDCEEHKASRALVLLAVNSHEALVDALNRLIDVTYMPAIEEGNQEVQMARIHARAALALAKGDQ